MRIPRLFVDTPLIADEQLDLPADAVHYLTNVLRARSGQSIILFNGDGSDYPCEIIAISKKNVQVLVNAQIHLNVESPLTIHLMQAVSKGDRMDFALQKAVELGVSTITPVITEFCNVKLNEDRWQKKVDQWQKVVVSACEQSQRNRVPEVNSPVSFNQMLSYSTDLQKVILAPKANHYLSQLVKPPKGFMLSIGPEGGFSEQEIYNAQQRGFIACNLGPRILRTETATVVTLSVLQSLFGDL